ncbi:hypothetical protein [Amycolatopsis sp. NPDC052450]|uniref:hypothetical protein n=1 Tax=Amycolatopsis sp. NPDC052450 TaxID=3363937 RepID=UPI0037CAC5A2
MTRKFTHQADAGSPSRQASAIAAMTRSMTWARTSWRQPASMTATSITMTSSSGPTSASNRPPMAIMSGSRSTKCT